jgi:hypothetical protein
MSDRLTVVFDDPSLYRRIKVRAAEEGVPVKKLIEEALQRYLGPAEGANVFDFAAFKRWQAGVDEFPAEDGGPTDLSDVKQHLYGYPPRHEREARVHRITEETAEYDPR